MTHAERRLWCALRALGDGARFRRQHPMGPYVVDFVCLRAGLVVEVDGSTHASDGAKAYDLDRTELLATWGMLVLRYTNAQVERQLDEVVADIARVRARRLRER